MLRSVGTGVGVAGNLAFKQNATLAADRGATAALAWLTSLPLATASETLQNDDGKHGYFSSWDTTFNPLTFDWTNAAVQTATSDDGARNEVRYVIHRLCKLPNQSATAGSGQECAVQGVIANIIGSGSSFQTPLRPLFRVTSRVQGPRNTLSYVQVVVY